MSNPGDPQRSQQDRGYYGAGWQQPAPGPQAQQPPQQQAPQGYYQQAPANTQWMHNIRTTADGVPLAPWGKRFAAWVIDGLILAVVGGLVFLFFWSAAFVVKDVRVAGVEGEVAESVERLAQVPRGRPLARGGAHEALEGEARPRNVILEFESLEQAKRYFNSPEYQAAKAKRNGAAVAEIVAVEGVE